VRKIVLTQRDFIITGLAALAAGVTVVDYATLIEPFLLEFKRVRMPLKGLPSNLDGAQLIQVSDLHLCPEVSENYIRRTLRKIAGLSAEFIVYTGDFITGGRPNFDWLWKFEGALPSGKLGTFGVLGNHDYGSGWRDTVVAEEVVRFAAANGIKILRNKSERREGLQFIGLDDLWGGCFDLEKAMRLVDADIPTIVLCHNPDGADVPGWNSFSGWILSGHTHGGQCRPPFLPPPFVPVQNRRYAAGHVDLGEGRHIYINRGVGYLRQIRFNVRPEVTLFTLAPA
jgi:uncharacterized protein